MLVEIFFELFGRTLAHPTISSLDLSRNRDFSDIIVGPIETRNLSYLFDGLETEKQYYYRVASKSGDLLSEYSIDSGRTRLQPPVLLRPQIISSGGITIRWKEVSIATHYEVDIAKDFEFSVIDGNYVVSDDNVVVTDLLDNTYYYYRVRSLIKDGDEITSSSEYSLDGSLTAPSVPVLYDPSNITTSTFSINWMHVDRSAYYEVDISEDDNYANKLSDYNSIKVYDTSLSVAGLSKGVTYYYRVRSVNGGSLSGYAEGNVTTLSLESPQVLESSDIDSISFTARWMEVEDAADYELQLVEDTIFLSQSRDYETEDTSIRLENLNSNTVYYHRVRSRNDNLGTSFYSRWVKTTTTVQEEYCHQFYTKWLIMCLEYIQILLAI